MKKKRSETRPVEVKPDAKRVTRNGARQNKEPASSRIGTRFLLKESPVYRFYPDVRRSGDILSRELDISLEETLLAFLDVHGVRDVGDIEEDTAELTFIDATYARSGVGANASIPTKKMFEAIFRNIQESQSVELTMASFQLLQDLEKRHPQVAVAEKFDKSSSQMTLRLDVDERVWSLAQLTVEAMEAADCMQPENSTEEKVPLNLLTLVKTVVMNVSDNKRQHMKGVSCETSNCEEDPDTVNILGQFLMLEHLINLIQRDLCCRWQVSEASMDASSVQGSYLFRLLCALRPDDRKMFFANLVTILHPNQQETEMDDEPTDDKDCHECLSSLTATMDGDISNRPGLLPSRSEFCHLGYRLLLMVVEIDYMTKKWSLRNTRSLRNDSFPLDVFNIFSDARNLEAYLQALDSPWTKLRFIVDYFVEHASTKIDVKGLKDCIDGETMESLLACFGEDKIAVFVHKFSADVLPLLLAHAFQAFLMIHAEGRQGDQDESGFHQAKLFAVSQSLLDTLTDLQAFEQQTEMVAVAENALQMAQSILNPLKVAMHCRDVSALKSKDYSH